MAKIKIPTVNERLLERYIRHSVYLEQLKTGEAKLVNRFLKRKVFPEIYGKLVGELGKVKNLETIGSIRKIRRLKKMLAAVQKISAAGVAKVEKKLIGRLVNISRFEAKWNADMISKTVPIDIDMTMPSNEVLKNLVTMRPMDGHKLGTWMAGYSTAVRVTMTKQIKMGIASGESLPVIGRRINKALNWKGKQAQYIARTAVSNVVHQAKEEVFKKNKDIVRMVQWISTLDVRTSMECINLDGKMFDVADGPRPPIHFNCRSSVIPITPSWQEFGIKDPPPATRASMNGAVPAKMNYRTWLRKQSKATQIKVLGKKRAELYRSGRVKIDRFVGRDLKPLTLKQLAKREGIDFKEVLPAPPTVINVYRGVKTGKLFPDEAALVMRQTRTGTRLVVKATGEEVILDKAASKSAMAKAVPPVTTTKVGTTFVGKTSKDFNKIVDDTIGAYPEKVKLALNDRGISYKVGERLTEIHPSLKGKHPRGWPPGTKFDSVSGIYQSESKAITVTETYRPIRQKTFISTPKNEVKGILNHETGHGFDASPEGLFYSSRPEFKTAYTKDFGAMTRDEWRKRGLHYYHQSGGSGRSETFAEIFADVMGQGAHPGNVNISQWFPNCKKYIEGILK